MNEGLLHEPSELFDMNGDGDILVILGSRCTSV
jgi:hypothetical protein